MPLEAHPASFGHYHPRRCISDLGSLASTLTPYREFDAVGVVMHLCTSHMTSRDADSPEQVVEMVYLADSQRQLMVLKVWMGLQVYC